MIKWEVREEALIGFPFFSLTCDLEGGGSLGVLFWGL